MIRQFAKEWLWLVSAALSAMGLALVFRGVFWRVGETGVLLVSIYVLSAVARTTAWAIRTVRTSAAS